MASKKENALFSQRLAAYLFDVIIISMVVSFITFPFYDNTSVEKLSRSNSELVEKYMNKEIDTNTYFVESVNLSYELTRKNGVISLVTIFLNVLYFICFQFKNSGQTIGKKLMHIQVVSNDDSELTINNMIFRSMIINTILVDILTFAFMLFASKTVSFILSGVFGICGYLLILISLLMVMFSKESRGLHDIIANTKVVKDNGVKELEVCEN